MTSFLLGFTLLAFYTLVGSALVGLWVPRGSRSKPPLQLQLLAPPLGMALTALCVALPSFHGASIRPIAPWIAGFLGTVSVAILLWRRPQFSIPPFALAFGVIVASGLFGFWPLFAYGPKWGAFLNGDMAHFCAVAVRLLDGPFWIQPDIEALSGFDLAMRKTFHHTLGNDRFASEGLLAFVAALTKQAPLSIYMPVLLAAYGTQIAATMALVCREPKHLARALWAGGILAVLPLSLFGLYNQLLPQCGGLALMLTAFTLLTSESENDHPWRWILPQTITLSAFAILYPEVSPYAVLAYFIHVALLWLKQRRLPWAMWKSLAISLTATAAILNKALLLMIIFMVFHRLPGGLTTDKELIFPYFLIPSGAAVFAGFQSIGVYLPPSTQSLAIVAAGLLIVAFLLFLVIRAYRTGEPALILCAVILASAGFFVVQGNDFGSFKSIMFAQPLIAAALAILITETRSRVVLAIVAVVLSFNVHMALYYRSAAGDPTFSTFADTRQVSKFGALVPPPQPGDRYYVDAPSASMVFEELVFAQLQGSYAYNANRAYFDNNPIPYPKTPLTRRLFEYLWPTPDYLEVAAARADTIKKNTSIAFSAWGTEVFLSRNPRIPHFENFKVITLRPEARQFNHLHSLPANTDSIFSVVPYEKLHDYLVFIYSTRGSLHYTDHRFDAAYYQSELDYHFAGKFFYRIGDFLLFEVINPSPGSRLRINLTRSLNPKGHKGLANLITLHGQQPISLPTFGAGSLNLISPPIQPLKIGDQHFIALELHAPRFRFTSLKPGLLSLYRDEVEIDAVLSVAYARDISVISETEYLALSRPSSLQNFPADLAQPGLEYSGLYEDGWISPDAYLVLNRPPGARELSFTLEVPGQVSGDTPTELNVQIGEGPATVHQLNPGSNTVTMPLAPDQTLASVACKLHFSRHIVLAVPDSRPVSGKLISITVR